MNSGTLEASSPAPLTTAPLADLSGVRRTMTGERSAMTKWSPATRIAFRFFFLYLVLFFFPLPSGLASPRWLSTIFDKPWHAVVSWVGRIFHIAIPNFSNGSGDTTYDYMRIGCMAVLAVVGTVVWSILDRRRTDYRTLLAWARIWMRYALAANMLTYGMVKVIMLQFGSPSYVRLTETFGESSPMGLLWTFMGFSRAYTFFGGASELLGAFLLCFRRTTTFGALVVIGVMTNVVMLNFCYDVPVKIGSSHMLMLAIFLAAPDLERVAKLLVLNRPTEAVKLGPDLPRRWMRTGAGVLKALLICSAVGTELHDAVKAAGGTHRAKAVPPDGWYAVSSFVQDGEEIAPTVTDLHRWKTFVLLRGYVRLWGADQSTRVFKVEGDPVHGPFKLLTVDESKDDDAPASSVGELRLDTAADGASTLEGTLEGHTLRIAMKRQTTESFPLMSRGFHWINEKPLNR